tara:strand:+ start:1704 stop:1895 length:192 start_codon:yes stop_codon:yes gene_type:complete
VRKNNSYTSNRKKILGMILTQPLLRQLGSLSHNIDTQTTVPLSLLKKIFIFGQYFKSRIITWY